MWARLRTEEELSLPSVFYHYYQPGLLDVNALYIGNAPPYILGIDTIVNPSLDFMSDAATFSESYSKACRRAR